MVRASTPKRVPTSLGGVVFSPVHAALVDVLADLDYEVLDGDYAVITYELLPPGADLPGALVVSRTHDLTATVRPLADRAAGVPEAARLGPVRVIDVRAPGAATGLTSTLLGAFAERGIDTGVVAVGPHLRLIVGARAWPEALAILRGLRDAARLLRADEGA